jgi:hypothetical protein
MYLCDVIHPKFAPNTVDLYNIKNIYDKRIEYKREKTTERRTDGAFISIPKNKFAEKLLKKHAVRNGLYFAKNPIFKV